MYFQKSQQYELEKNGSGMVFVFNAVLCLRLESRQYPAGRNRRLRSRIGQLQLRSK